MSFAHTPRPIPKGKVCPLLKRAATFYLLAFPAGTLSDGKEIYMKERTGVITFMGNPMTLVGDFVEAGQKAPGFTVLANDMSPKTLADYSGNRLLISVVPSLDTGVCDMQTRRFNNEVASLGANVRILTISCDLPFAQARWCGAAGVDKLETLSDYKDLSFGHAYGLLIKELRLLTRAVLVVDSKGMLTHMEVVPEVSHEVNFEAALAAIAAAG